MEQSELLSRISQLETRVARLESEASDQAETNYDIQERLTELEVGSKGSGTDTFSVDYFDE